MPLNTIIIPFRATAPVPRCLASLEASENIHEHFVVLAQHGGNPCDFEHHDLRLTHWYVYNQSPFHPAKLLNAAVKRARTPWITVLQPDVLVPPNYITELEYIMSNRDCRRCYFPVRYLDSTATHHLEERFNCFYERIIPAGSIWKHACETHKRHRIGTDCFTVRTCCYLDLGGYDERFHDASLAEIDFGRRWINAFGVPNRAECDLFHRWRRLSFLNDHPADDAQERNLFAERERNGFPPLEVTQAWGVFAPPARE